MALKLAPHLKEMLMADEFGRLSHSSPWPHFVLDGLLSEDDFADVQKRISTSEPAYTTIESHPAKIQLDHLPDFQLAEFFFSNEMWSLLESIAGKKLKPNQEVAIQLRRMTEDSPEFPPHVDLIGKPSLIALYYVAPEWRENAGGELVLMKNETGGDEKPLAPVANRLVLFWSNDQHWHMVRRVKNWTRLMVLTEWLVEE